METSSFYKKSHDNLNKKAECEMWNASHLFLLSKVIEFCNFKDGDRVLDVGCGSARICDLIPKRVDYVGSDISSTIVEIAKQNYPHFSFHECSAFDMSIFKDEEFDVIICTEVMEHMTMEEWIPFIKELKRVCKKGGRFVFSMPNFYYLWAYIPYSFFPIKSRVPSFAFLKYFFKDMCYETYITSEGEVVPFHRRIKPLFLKNTLENVFGLSVDKLTTTYWYNNRPIHNTFPGLQMLIHKISTKTAWMFGSQVVISGINK